MYDAILDKYIVSLELGEIGIVRNVEVHVGKIKLFEDFHVVDMETEPTCPLLVERGCLAIANAVIDCKKAKIAVGERLTGSIFRVKELDFGNDNEPYWTTIGKRESYKPRTSEDDIGIVRNVEVHVGKIKLFEDFHVVDMETEPTCPLLVERGCLAIANAVIDCKKAKIAVGERLTGSIFRVKELDFAFGRHLVKIHGIWAKFGKKTDKILTLLPLVDVCACLVTYHEILGDMIA
nr:hypothetical protein [Tanacetum cinerariifolium]